MRPHQLVFDQAIKRHGRDFTLGPVSLAISSGVTCLVGANGAGKSTMFRLAAGVDRPTAGSIELVANNGRASLGYLPQDPVLPRAATCEQFLYYVAWLYRVPSSLRDQAVKDALSSTGLLDKQTTRIGTLSGGMVRRLGIAQALVHEPGLVLLDEPTAGLDPRQRIALRETISGISHGRIVLMATHLVEDVRAVAQRVIVLDCGQVVFDGDVPSLAQNAAPDAPGDTDLERAIASLLGPMQ